MALMKCPECRGDVSFFAVTCPKCGYPIARGKSGGVGGKGHQIGKAIANLLRIFVKKK